MIKKMMTWTVLALACWAVLIVGFVVGLGVMSEYGWIVEDSFLFNCRFMGNLTCGPTAPWHGFVNF